MRSRRRFVRDAGIVAGGALALPAVLRAQVRGAAPSDQVRVAVIGCNGMGFSDLQSMMRRPDVDCIAICDVDRSVRERRQQDLEVARP